MKEFFGSWLLRWLTVPYRSRLFTMASKPFYQIADRILGSRFLAGHRRVLHAVPGHGEGLRRHADEVEQLLADPRTTFVVVSTLEAAPSYEAAYFARELVRREYHLGAIIANRVLPASFTAEGVGDQRPQARQSGRWRARRSSCRATRGRPDTVRDVLTEIGARFHDVAVVATREAERRAELAELCHLLVTAPVLDRDVNDIADLLELAAHFTS